MGYCPTCTEAVRASRDAQPSARTPMSVVSRASATMRLPPSRIPARVPCDGVAHVARLLPARPSEVPSNVERVPQTIFPVLEVTGKGGGQPLPPQVGADMANRLGADFSDVRVHTDPKAARSAAAIAAKAYTVGNEVVFGHGYFAPDTSEGLRTLAHELTHVQQQRKGPVQGIDTGRGVALSDPSDSFEQEAQATAIRVTLSQGALSVQRCGGVAHDGEYQCRAQDVVQRQTSVRSVTVQRDGDGNGDGEETQDQTAPIAAPGMPIPAPDVSVLGQDEELTPTSTAGSTTKCNVDNFWMKFDDWDISWPGYFSDTTTIRLPVQFRVDLSAGCTKADCVIGQRKKGRTSNPGSSFNEWTDWAPDGPEWWDGTNWHGGGNGSWDWFGKDGADFEDEPGFYKADRTWYPLYWGGVGGTGSFQFQTYIADKATGVDVDSIRWMMLIDCPAPKTGTYSHG